MSVVGTISLVASLIAIVSGGIAVRHWWYKRQHGEPDLPDLPADRARSPFKILVVDDRKFEHVERLKRDGFDVTFRNDIDRFRDIEDYQFDLILMDLHGVGLALSEDGGRGLIQHIKTKSPSQIVIAYTAHQGGPSAFEEVFQVADQVLDKAAGYLTFKTCIEKQLDRLRTSDHYLETLPSLPATAGRRLKPILEAALNAEPTGTSTKEVITSLPEVSRTSAKRLITHAIIVGKRLRLTD